MQTSNDVCKWSFLDSETWQKVEEGNWSNFNTIRKALLCSFEGFPCTTQHCAVIIKCSVSLIKTLRLKRKVKRYKLYGDARQIKLARYPYFVANKLMLSNITQRNNSNINRYLEIDATECRHSVPIGTPCCVLLETLNMLQTFGNLMWFWPASSLICGNKKPTRCNRGFYCRSYCLRNMFRALLCPSSGAQEYYTVVAACGISCCKNVKNNFVIFCGICVLSLPQKLVMPETCWASNKICNKNLCCI